MRDQGQYYNSRYLNNRAMDELAAPLRESGELPFNYNSVFSHEYCGRYPGEGVDGSGRVSKIGTIGKPP